MGKGRKEGEGGRETRWEKGDGKGRKEGEGGRETRWEKGRWEGKERGAKEGERLGGRKGDGKGRKEGEGGKGDIPYPPCSPLVPLTSVAARTTPCQAECYRKQNSNDPSMPGTNISIVHCAGYLSDQTSPYMGGWGGGVGGGVP